MIEPCAINSPVEFIHVLRQIKQAVALGEIRQIYPAQSIGLRKISIADVLNEGPWPDYIEMYFEEVKTQVTYKLTAETYHGTGGSWQQVLKAV